MRGGAEGLRVAGAILEMIRQGWGVDGSAFAEAFATLYMPDATREQLQHLAGMQRASATADNAVALRRAIDAFDVSDLLGKVRAPTLVLHARQDAVHPVEQSLALAEGIKGADLRVLEGRNHVPLPHDPCWEEMMIATEDFLARNIGGGT
ncbi:MAG: alpha/beta hydrolase [Rhodobacteraceae bacterium]|nr:alpha/beta hydrolase [Paracoccaceae bacterium]